MPETKWQRDPIVTRMLFCVDENWELSMWPVQTGWSDQEAAEAALEFGRRALECAEGVTDFSSGKPVTTFARGPFSLDEKDKA